MTTYQGKGHTDDIKIYDNNQCSQLTQKLDTTSTTQTSRQTTNDKEHHADMTPLPPPPTKT